MHCGKYYQRSAPNAPFRGVGSGPLITPAAGSAAGERGLGGRKGA
jgi:hypothetical protein